MTKKLTFIVLAFMLCIGKASAQDIFQSNKLTKVWETDDGLFTPESAHYNKNDNTIYVSNIAGDYKVDGNKGYISKLDVDGNIIKQKWVEGLKAPKGIYTSRTNLYVTDIDCVLEIDLQSGKILNEFRNPKSKGLNDVTVADDGSVFISDSDGKCIFKIENGSMNVFVEDDRIRGMNGIYAEGNLLYVGGNNNFYSVNQKTKEIKSIAEQVGYLDGIEKVAEGLFVSSDWQGKVFLIEPGKGNEKILDTTPKEINAADLGYIADKKLLLVPTFNNNKVIAYQLDLK